MPRSETVQEDPQWAPTVNEIVDLTIGKIVDWGQQHGPNSHTGMAHTLEAVAEALLKKRDGFLSDAEAEGEPVNQPFQGSLSVVSVARSNARWVRSEFPHPLVTLDYDKDDNLINVSVAGHAMRVVAR